ncbi:MAG TPA: transposase, partial [Candidatus Syntrophosphaera sp.]|nr:transposase [Candidatus Syntrophosphaera sp.]
MFAKEEASVKAEIVRIIKPISQGRFYRDASCQKTLGYRARDPGGSPLSRIVLNNLPEFEQWLKNPSDSQPHPHPAVITALEKFVECGVMRYGAVRFRCPECGTDMFVAFSCKRRGLCPSCDAKRSAIVTAGALDRLLPPAPYRQWVLVVPKRLRYFINRRPDLAGQLSKIFAGEINRFLQQKGGGVPAQLHFIQRFGGALNLHVHVHAVVSDGVFNLKTNIIGQQELGFAPVPGPTTAQLTDIVTAIRKKFIRRVCRTSGLSQEAAADLLSWKNSGFSIHESVRVKDWDRDGLERLLRYCSRPAISPARLVYADKANMVIYRSEPRAGKAELLTMTPVDFLRRWGLLMPPPNKNLIHYYGALAPRSPLRPLLVAASAKETDRLALREKGNKLKKKASSWAACLARVFEIFP